MKADLSKVISEEGGWVSSCNTWKLNVIVSFELFEVRVKCIEVAEGSYSHSRKQEEKSTQEINCSEVPVSIRNCLAISWSVDCQVDNVNVGIYVENSHI